MSNVFDPVKLEKLNNPLRLRDIPPDYIWEKLRLDSASIGIDLGAGTGFYSIQFCKFLGNGTIYAADISDAMLEWMNNNVVGKFPEIKPVKIEDNVLPIEDSIANFVLMIALHHELDDHQKTLSEAYRVLKDSGKIAIVDWKKEPMSYGPPLAIRYDTVEVERQLVSVGFREISTFTGLKRFFVVIATK